MLTPSLYYRLLRRIIFPPFWRKLDSVVGLENIPTSGSYLLAMNHVDWLDGFYLAATIDRARGMPIYFLTKTKNYWWTTLAVKIPADRGEVIDYAVHALQAGKSIVNFPEGQRNFSSTLLPGKTGTVRIAIAARVPVIPVGITCDPGRTMAQSFQYLFSSRHRIQLRFGPPLTFSGPVEDMTADDLHRETAQLMNAIAPLAGKQV